MHGRRACGIDITDGDAAVILLNSRHLAIITNEVADLFCERLADHIHAADGLKHRGLKIIVGEVQQIAPNPRFQDIRQGERFARQRQGIQPTARSPGIAAELRRDQIGLVPVIAIERPSENIQMRRPK